ncbi:MAG TPA: hypothetical protein VH373_05820 [Jatrophihabitantaceae bacterium]|jgi:hypothetical protein
MSSWFRCSASLWCRSRAHLAGSSAGAEEAVSLLLLAAHDAGLDPAPVLKCLPAT